MFPIPGNAGKLRSCLKWLFTAGWSPVCRDVFCKGVSRVMDWLLPPSCAACGDEIAPGGGLLCGACFGRLRFVHPPFCDACGLPVTEEDVAEHGWLCVECERSPPLWHRGRAAFLYEGEVRRLVLGLKYGSRSEHAATLARFMVEAGKDLLEKDAVLVAVPVHRWRLWRRGYNQAALMANVISRETGLACYPDGLQRQLDTSALARLSRRGRREQVRGAIRVEPRYRDKLKGRPIILIDDILTTGATAESCTNVLLKNGCVSVDILVAARVSLS